MDAERLNPKPAGVSKEYQDQRAEAVESLRELLATGDRPAAEVHERMEAIGHGRRQVDFAAKTLGIVKKQDRQGGRTRTWIWSLPSAESHSQQVGEFDVTNWPG